MFMASTPTTSSIIGQAPDCRRVIAGTSFSTPNIICRITPMCRHSSGRPTMWALRSTSSRPDCPSRDAGEVWNSTSNIIWRTTPIWLPHLAQPGTNRLRRGKSGGRVGIGAPVVSPDCTSQQPPIIPNSNPPAVYSRIYIAYPFNLGGAGLRFNDSDITTADKFDSILRVYSGNPAATPAVAPQDHLVVCIGPGTFQTRGNYDFVINIKHTSNRGFAVGPYWKIHGFGTSATTLQLADFLENPPAPGLPPRTNTVLATVSDSSPGIEVSDLTIDDNFPILRQTATGMGMNLLNLQAVALRSDQGGHWIHNINVINAAGYVSEAFPFQIMSVNNSSPSQGNVIEYVTMSAWGGGSCTAIVMANAIGSVRFNVVDGYEKGFGGWSMGQVWMYDNFALNTSYGFNIDSLNNDGVNIWFNEIRHPLSYGIVVGSPGGQFSNFGIIYNTISIASDSVTGIVLGGNVTNSIVGRNNIIADGVSV